MSAAPDSVFLDTTGLIGHFLPTDSLHGSATHVLRSLARDATPLICSDWVLMEFLNSACKVNRRAQASAFVRTLLAHPLLTVVEASHLALMDAFDLYQSRSDKEWSLVDCASMLICQEMGVRRVFTHDRHFRQAGFDVLL